MSCNNCPSPITNQAPLSSTCPGVVFVSFLSVLELFLKKQCDLEDPCGRITPRDEPEISYDFIVIGAGSGGATVAARLSEEKCFSVLLLETGLDEISWGSVPALPIASTSLNWQHRGEVEKNSCLNKKEKRCTFCGGKVLGGTSSINGMMYMRGSHKDYNDWEKLGNKYWSYEDVLPFFKKSENNIQIDELDPVYHSKGGPLPVSRFNSQPPMTPDILEAAKELGYNTVDLNGKTHTGWMVAQTTTNKGSRYSTARAFLRPARSRSNLHIMINSTVTTIVFDDHKNAVAVEFYKNGRLFKVGIKKEVIVSAGAINSPQILMNSGIGPKEELEKAKVPVVHNLPGVGENFHDHVQYLLPMTINEKEVSAYDWASVSEYLLNRKGPLSSTGGWQVTGMINTKFANPEDDHPDIHMVFGGYEASCPKPPNTNPGVNLRRPVSIMPVVLHPKSRGYVRLSNNNPLSRPLVTANIFDDPNDATVLVEGIKFAIRMTKTRALAKYDFQLDKTPVKNCEHLEFGSDPYWECAVRHDTSTGGHYCGSCKMGPDSDPMAVVDDHLKVKGVWRVRIADTSIMPRVTSGNTNAPAIMIGERAAHFIKMNWMPEYCSHLN
ncbi:glucose dehydrogenase [FAD, quinone]-like [Leptopilina heterotoma]|uniref:glucose dehydrogenase [FAD, quinone]-like n=1 Tax=Leptopilina heterotoma TaxID=63436 RepID=UPI001CA8ABFD|nr:glucose dehydrogenase [FAD, quinone]-like [Leptopilina heterotoma]